jgi:hypothetical protein
MRVTVRYAAQAREAAGTAEEQLELEGAGTVGQLVAQVARAHGDPLRRFLVRDDGAPHPSSSWWATSRCGWTTRGRSGTATSSPSGPRSRAGKGVTERDGAE